jgi:thiol peroxidase
LFRKQSQVQYGRLVGQGEDIINNYSMEVVMAEERKGAVTMRGNPLTLGGPEIKVGQDAPDFTAVDNSLQPVRLSDAKGKVVILSSVPSVDTPVCDTETRRFNQEAAALGAGIEIWTLSMDLPFAQKRWCGAAGVDRVKTLSDFRDRAFSQNYGVLIKDGPLAGVTARAVFVVGKDGKVKHVEYVKEIATEPQYDAILSAAKAAANA